MRLLLVTILFTLFSINSNAQNGESRIALVIGNSAYSNVPLKNPVNDANLISTTLEKLGFTVYKTLNANKQQIESIVRQFASKLAINNVALFYYAGHGMQANGLNYLIPIGANLRNESDLKYEAVDINFIVDEFKKYPQNTNIIILDACRDNPLASWARGGTRGFKAISPSSGTIISFATAEGCTASDGLSTNGLFTEKLVQQMKIAQPIETVFKNTRIQVLKASNGKQSPQEWSMLTGNFQFTNGTYINQQQLSETYISTKEPTNDNLIITEEIVLGSIRITCEINGEFYFDGMLKGIFSKGKVYTLNNIEIGNHTIKVGNWKEIVKVEKDKTIEILVNSFYNYIETIENFNLEMVAVRGGSIQMNTHEEGLLSSTIKTLSVSDYFISKFEITFAQWRTIMGTNPSNFRDCDNCPVEVPWNETQSFISKLNQVTGKNYRLPTEAEFYYAERGGSKNKGYKCAGSNNASEVAWNRKNSNNKTHPVGLLKPNELDLYDMNGNAWEWCHDRQDTDWWGIGNKTTILHIMRGCSYIDDEMAITVGIRVADDPINNRGFRLVLLP